MSQVFLLGNPGTKRTLYLGRAAQQAGLPALLPEGRGGEGALLAVAGLLDWEGWPHCLPQPDGARKFIKIDPPLWHSSSLDELEDLTRGYQHRLALLASMAQADNWEFLNHPDAIRALLDKRGCKETLARAGLPVTECLEGGAGESIVTFRGGTAFDENLASTGRGKRVGYALPSPPLGEGKVERLLEAMEKRHMHQIFMKPLYGSGAAGVAAFRWQPKTGRMALYTCAMETPGGGLANTKKLRCFTKKDEVVSLLGRILQLRCIIERWYAKAEYQGNPYDLRAVVQDGRLDFLLARLSRGPITNLHLNNHPMEASRLNLPEEVWASVSALCQKAMACFSGLRSAGIDILLEKGSRTPRIIEMNAQGDLLNQDIYHENLIYRHQADMIRRWIEEGKCNLEKKGIGFK